MVFSFLLFFFFKQKTAYELRISDWSSDVCSSDLAVLGLAFGGAVVRRRIGLCHAGRGQHAIGFPAAGLLKIVDDAAGALFAQGLVQFLASCGIGVADDEQQRVVRRFGLAR